MGGCSGSAASSRTSPSAKRAEAQREELLAITERARSEAERAIEIVERVQAVTDLPFAHLSLDEALPELLVRIHRMLAVDITVFLLLDEQRESLRVHDAVGLDVARACQVAIPLGEGFAGRVAKEQRPIMIEAVTRHDVLNPALLERKVRSLLGVPVLSHGRVLGVLHVGACEPRRFTEDDRRLLQLVADRLALVIQRGRLYEVEHAARAAAEASLRARAEVERLKDDLTAMVVHDLKSPVTAIAMLTQLARRKGQDLPDSQLRALLQIERTCREMTRLIQNVLEIGKLEEGKLPVSPAPIVLAELVDEVVTEYGPMAEQTGHRLTAAIGPDLPCVLADRALLKRVLVNLVVNALRHSGSDEVRVEGTRDTAPARLRLQVIDHGHGIAEDDQAHVFEKFASIRRSGAREPSSDTGLGLPFCKLATERMGGEIRLSSHREVGTIFTLVLPSQLVGSEPTPARVKCRRAPLGRVAWRLLDMVGRRPRDRRTRRHAHRHRSAPHHHRRRHSGAGGPLRRCQEVAQGTVRAAREHCPARSPEGDQRGRGADRAMPSLSGEHGRTSAGKYGSAHPRGRDPTFPRATSRRRPGPHRRPCEL